MLAADMSTDSSYMLTWGSVIYNDLLAPFRKKQVVRESRAVVESRDRRLDRRVPAAFTACGTALRARRSGTYLTVTGTIYLASMSTLLIACCYWKRANSWAPLAPSS